MQTVDRTAGSVSAQEQDVVLAVCGDVSPQSKLFASAFWEPFQFSLIRCSENAASVFSLCGKLKPVLMLARQSFIEAQPRAAFTEFTLRRRRLNVLAILDQDGDERTADLIRVGCRGVLLPNLSEKRLQRAIEATLNGELWVPRSVLSTLVTELLASHLPGKESTLTPREQHILELTQQGRKNCEIAELLFISQETVRWHKRRLYRKLDVVPPRKRLANEKPASPSAPRAARGA
jgi:DNA-binding NarL/FixJ family response regulator